MLARLRVARNFWDVVGPENEDVAPMRPDKVVTEFIDEDLIAGVDRAARNHFTFLVATARQHFEILLQRVRRRINEVTLPLAHDLRKGEEEPVLPGIDLLDDLVLVGHD